MSPRSLVRCFIACVVTVAGLAALTLPSAGAQQTPTAESTYADVELMRALEATALTEAWIAASDVSAEASFLQIDGTVAYDEARSELLAILATLVEGTAELQDRNEQLDDLEYRVDELEQFVRDLRHEIIVSTESPSSFGPARLVSAAQRRLFVGAILHGFDSGDSDDGLARPRDTFAALRQRLQREIQRLSHPAFADPKSIDGIVARFSALSDDFDELRDQLEAERVALAETGRLLTPQQEAARALMPALHDLRTLRPTAVNGLPLVTVDAYISGAALVDANCPVDWTLLAGIGRAESAHGTLGDSSVQANGRVTTQIFGPLLDGGATEREAEQAAALEAEALLLAEEEAAAAEAAAKAEAESYDPAVWGSAATQRAEELARAEQSRAPVGLAAPPVEVEEAEAPRFSPQLWGDVPDDLENHEDDEEPADQEGADEEELEFKGNGFAVIADSDDGRLDGNDQWDRAVGPMQFIPETWSYWATDGNGDGIADPQNLYDAAASAGRFLCHLSRTKGSSPTTFVLGYNSSSTYVANVLSYAQGYAARDLPVLD